MTAVAPPPSTIPNSLLETLPASWYTDPAILEIEQKAIFSTTWQYVGTTESLARVGDYFTTTLVDVPIIVARSRQGISAVVNVCRHRFHEVASGSGNTRAFSCPYHAWTYALDGSLIGAPRCDKLEGFDRSEFPLKALPVATWGPMVFVSLDPDVEPFQEWIGPVDTALRGTGCEIETLVARKRTTFEIKGNWKVVAENFLECYHCQVAHPNYAKTFEVDSAGYTFEMSGGSFIANTLPQAKFRSGEAPAPYEMSGPISVNQNDYLWPNFAPMVWPGQNNMVVYSFRPVSVNETVGYFDYFFAPGGDNKAEQDFITFFDEVGAEDVPLIDSVQRGLASGQVSTGRLVPDEGQIAHFHQLVRKAVAR